MKIPFCLVFPVAAATVLSACQPSNDVTADRERLLQTDREFAAFSVKNGAAEAFKKYLTPDAMQLPAGKSPVYGRETIYRSMAPNQDKYALDWEPQRAEVARSGELGWSWGTYTVRYTDASGKPAEEHGKYVNIWKKQTDGSWRVYLDTGNQSPAPQ